MRMLEKWCRATSEFLGSWGGIVGPSVGLPSDQCTIQARRLEASDGMAASRWSVPRSLAEKLAFWHNLC